MTNQILYLNLYNKQTNKYSCNFMKNNARTKKIGISNSIKLLDINSSVEFPIKSYKLSSVDATKGRIQLDLNRVYSRSIDREKGVIIITRLS